MSWFVSLVMLKFGECNSMNCECFDGVFQCHLILMEIHSKEKIRSLIKAKPPRSGWKHLLIGYSSSYLYSLGLLFSFFFSRSLFRLQSFCAELFSVCVCMCACLCALAFTLKSNFRDCDLLNFLLFPPKKKSETFKCLHILPVSSRWFMNMKKR